MRFAALGSGSKGNSAVVECQGHCLLVDAGLSARQIKSRLALLGVDASSLSGILLTHEHGDHVAGLRVFLKDCPVPLYATPATRKAVCQDRPELAAASWKTFETYQDFGVGCFAVKGFSIQHDAVDPVGYVISGNQRQLGFLSDVGHVTQSVTQVLHGLHALYVEANYDEELLAADTKRPWSIKQRISSRHGHLSNTQVCELLGQIAHPALGAVVLGHLSSDCNHPDVVMQCLKQTLGNAGHGQVRLHCATQDSPSDWIHL
jgi:phosphoribosyl 1,2-cyclic phosphodiesterase